MLQFQDLPSSKMTSQKPAVMTMPEMVFKLLLDVYRRNIKCSVHMLRRFLSLELSAIERKYHVAGIVFDLLFYYLSAGNAAAGHWPPFTGQAPVQMRHLTVYISFEFARELNALRRKMNLHVMGMLYNFSRPPIYGRSTSGTVSVPSSFWKCSKMTTNERASDTAVPFSV